MPRLSLGVLLTSCALACTGPTPSGADTDDAVTERFDLAGPFVVGTSAFTATDAARDRTLHAQVWYPADDAARPDAEAGFDVAQFGSGDEVATLTGLLDTAPEPGTLRLAHAAIDATPAGAAPWPVVLFSHCLDCTRFSTFEIAERLASHGFAVIAPDHAGGALYDRLAGESAPLGAAFLDVRAADLSFLLDEALSPTDSALPAALRGRFDASRVGVYGHSFGAITTGRVLMLDDRPRSGLAFGAPMENPLTPGVTLTDLHVPLMFVVATEDNSITEVGNLAIRNNFAAANPPVTKVEVADAGHYSFTTVCGIIPDFDAGCATDDTRQTDGTPFQYADITQVRALAASWAVAWFRATLDGSEDARAWMDGPPADASVTVETRTE